MAIAALSLSDADESRQLLPWPLRRVVLVLVIAVHVAIGWALTRVNPEPLIVTEGAPMEVRVVAAAPAVERLIPPPPEDTPPPKADLESEVRPPPPDLPPPLFAVHARLPPPPKPQAPPTRPGPAPQTGPAEPVHPPATPKAANITQVRYLDTPRPKYPESSLRADETGTVMLNVLVGADGRPQQVMVLTSSGFPRLDDSAKAGVRKWRFHPYAEDGVPQAKWVQVPIDFKK